MTASLSVVLPVHNAGRWFLPALTSVLEQDVDGLEVVVADDASTDGSGDLARSTGDPRVRVLTLERGGVVAALNSAVQASSAPLVARMDADDVSLPGRLALQSERFEDSTVVACGCAYERIDADDVLLDTVAPPPDDLGVRRRMHVRNPWAGGSLMVRRSALDAIGGFSDSHRSAEDYEVLVRLAARGSLTTVPSVLYRWRVHETSTSRTVRNLEAVTTARIQDQLWAESRPAPASGRALARRAAEHRATLDPAVARLVAAQMLRTEVLLMRAMAVRGARRDASRQALAVAALLPSTLAPAVADLPSRVRALRRHRR